MSISKSPWKIMNSIAKKDFIPNKEEINSINSFWLCKWLSNDLRNIIVAEMINTNYKNITNNSQYWFSRACVKYVPFIRKKEKSKIEFKNNREEMLFKCIKIHYSLSNDRDKEALTYLDMMSENEKNRILKMYSHLFSQKELIKNNI